MFATHAPWSSIIHYFCSKWSIILYKIKNMRKQSLFFFFTNLYMYHFLHFLFLCLDSSYHLETWYFPFTWGTYFTISCIDGLLKMNSFSVFLLQKFYLAFIFEIYLFKIQNLGWVSFSTLKISFDYHLAYMVSEKYSEVTLCSCFIFF